jgi:hypothetical protein
MEAIKEFINRVKDRDIKITGVVHVGAHNGDEVAVYKALNIPAIICFEPAPQPAADFIQRWLINGPESLKFEPHVHLIPVGLADTSTLAMMQLTSGTRQQSTFLPIINDEIGFGGSHV